MELVGSCFASSRPHFGSRGFWRGNREHLVEADRGWCYTMGEQVPESFIMSQLLGLLLPSAKTTMAGWCSWQIRCRVVEARPTFFWCVLQGNVSRSCFWMCCVFFQDEVTCVHERAHRREVIVTCSSTIPVWAHTVPFIFFLMWHATKVPC